MQTCKGECGRTLPFEDFYFRKDSGKYKTECKECVKNRNKKNKEAKPEQYAQTAKAWYETNRDQELERRKQWTQDNAERVKEYNNSDKARESAKRWYDKNGRDYGKKWRASNPDAVRRKNNNRRALVLEAGELPKGAWEALLRVYGAQCMNPECDATEDLTLDHVIPLASGGANSIANAQILCRSCNSGKRDRHSTDYRDLKSGILVDTL